MTPRPVLRPGFVAVRRSAAELQVGLGAGHDHGCVVVPDDAAVRRLLDLLADAGRPWAEPEELSAIRALRSLRAGGVVVPAPSTALERRLAGQHGSTWPARVASRAAAAVGVAGPATLTTPLTALLAGEGIPVTGPSSEGLQGLQGLQVVLAEGPVRRDLLDGAPGASLPVSLLPDGWEIGPLVVPGRTACLRCVDAARSARDPRLPWVVDQLARACPTVTVSAVELQLGLALVVREVAAWVDGDVPSSWSATLGVGAVGAPVRTEWPRHPECGCAWDVLLAADLVE